VDTKFAAPLLVWIHPPHGQQVVRSVRDVDAAVAALVRDGLGNYGASSPEWQVAMESLRRAKSEPTPEAVEAARSALKTVAVAAGALLDG
jgi:hypothetical protein